MPAEYTVTATAANGIGIGHARLDRAVGVAGPLDILGNGSPLFGTCHFSINHVTASAVSRLPRDHDLLSADTCSRQHHVVSRLRDSGCNAVFVKSFALKAICRASANCVGVGFSSGCCVIRIGGCRDALCDNRPARPGGLAVNRVGLGIQGGLPCDGDAAAGDPCAGECYILRFLAGNSCHPGVVIAGTQGLSIDGQAAHSVCIGGTGNDGGILITGAGGKTVELLPFFHTR